jgi:hypothetical protein
MLTGSNQGAIRDVRPSGTRLALLGWMFQQGQILTEPLRMPGERFKALLGCSMSPL